MTNKRQTFPKHFVCLFVSLSVSLSDNLFGFRLSAFRVFGMAACLSLYDADVTCPRIVLPKWFIYLFGRESKGTFEWQMVFKEMADQGIVKGHTFYKIYLRAETCALLSTDIMRICLNEINSNIIEPLFWDFCHTDFVFVY